MENKKKSYDEYELITEFKLSFPHFQPLIRFTSGVVPVSLCLKLKEYNSFDMELVLSACLMDHDTLDFEWSSHAELYQYFKESHEAMMQSDHEHYLKLERAFLLNLLSDEEFDESSFHERVRCEVNELRKKFHLEAQILRALYDYHSLMLWIAQEDSVGDPLPAELVLRLGKHAESIKGFDTFWDFEVQVLAERILSLSKGNAPKNKSGNFA